jgi:hypothetical protein
MRKRALRGAHPFRFSGRHSNPPAKIRSLKSAVTLQSAMSGSVAQSLPPVLVTVQLSPVTDAVNPGCGTTTKCAGML